MSKFAARMVAGLSSIYDRLGDQATFQNRAAESTGCTIIVVQELNDYGDTPAVSAESVLIRVRCSELSARPLRDEVFTVDESGDTYTVVRTLQASDEFEHMVLAK